MKIGLDLDGVVFCWTTAAAVAFELYRGYEAESLPREQDYWDHLKDCVKADDWEWLWRGPGLEATNEQLDCVYPGAGRAMRRLAASGKLIIATHRPSRAAVPTAAFLAHHKVQFSELHVMGAHTAKSGVWKDCNVIIEDKPSNVEDAFWYTQADLFVPRRPYNEEPINSLVDEYGNPERIHRYTDLKEVTRWVRNLTSTTTK